MRLYRWLLRVCSATLARDYGAAMEDTFTHRLAAARRAGRWRCAQVWRREMVGLLALAVSERWGAAARMERRRRTLERRWKAGRMEGMVQEIRHATRRLLRSPAFTLAAAMTLALAIGANASIFAVVQRVLINPLPYPDSDRLIEVEHGAGRLNVPTGLGITQGLYHHYSDRAQTLDGLALYRTDDLTLTGDGEPARLRVARTTPTLASVMRVSPALGRWFTEAEGAPGAAAVAVLSHGFWMRRYGGNPSVLGRSMLLGGVPTDIVGIMPPAYAFPHPRVEVWIAEPLSRAAGFGVWNYDAIARLRDGATVAGAQAELAGLIADLPQAFPNDILAEGNGAQIALLPVVRTQKDATIGGVARALWILLASVGLVLLVACANVANLFLVRSDARQREVAVRRALGAGGFNIARYFLTESALLSAAGGVVGALLAWGAVRLLLGFGPSTLPRLHEVQLDAVSLAFTFVVSVVAALMFGAIPLWRPSQIAASLHESGRSHTASRGRHRVRHLLMAGQVALAMVLLVLSGLMVRSFQTLRERDPGFDGSSALAFSIGLPDTDYRTREAAVATHQAVIDRLAALPGVTAVSASTCLPLAGACNGNTLRVEGRTYPAGTVPPLALFRGVAGGYVETLGIRLLRGRTIDRGDVERKELNVVINDALAQRFFPNEDPIGKRVASNRPPPRTGQPSNLTWLTIVGVVATTPMATLAEATPMPQLFMPMSIAGGPGLSPIGAPNTSVMSFVVRSATPPLGLVPAVRQAIDAVDANLALDDVRTLEQTLDRAAAQMAFTMVLLAIAAASALLLGVIGIYGVMSYIVSQRTSEIGVRLALGAAPSGVAAQIVRQGGLVALAGIAIGLAAAFAGSRLIASLLYGISPRDPGVFAATTVTLLVVALLACWLPARRAARLSPVEALRAE